MKKRKYNSRSYPKMGQIEIEKFLMKIKIEDNCWIWIGMRNRDGYGGFNIDRPAYRAHRLMWELFGPSIKPGQCLLHICDNTFCVRPTHLKIGTQKDNVVDRDNKGRSRRGADGRYIHV